MGSGMMAPRRSLGENPLPATEEVLAQGRALYSRHCAVCHGTQGRGDGPAAAGLNPRPPDLRNAAPNLSGGMIAAQIRDGRGAMPPFANALTESEIWSLTHHVQYLTGR